MGFLELRLQCGVSYVVRRGAQGAYRVASGKSGLHPRDERECVIALESWEGTRASRHIEEGLSRSFSGCGRKPWVPSTSAGDLRELLRVLLRSQGYCEFTRGLSGLHWVWCNGRGPHLECRQEPQGSSPFLTPIAGSVQSWDRRVRPSLVCRNGTPLASRVVHGVTGHLSSCVWNLWVFPDYALGCQGPYVLCLHPQGCLSRGARALGSYQKWTGKSGSFGMWHHPRGYVSNFLVRQASS